MRTARPLGLSPDGTSLIVVIEGGEQVAIPADERLKAALRNDRARMGQLEIDMDSALRPRDIQARIRAGESLEAVAQAAGVPPEKIEPFAGPVLAERDHIAGLAQANPVRRAGDAVAHRSLRAVVTDRLLSRGVDADTVEWDAWRTEDRHWTVRLSYESGSAPRQADFVYDQTGRFSAAANDDARWLTGEQTNSHGPQPGRKRRSGDDGDELGFDDELAIVRAIQPQFAVTPDVDDDLDDDDSADNEDAYAEGDLAEVDGVYDIVPGDRSSMDVLYDMLSSFDEDSVQIYAGLVRPRPEQAAAPMLDEGPATTDDDGPTEPTERIGTDNRPAADELEVADEHGIAAAPDAPDVDLPEADAGIELRVTDAEVEDFAVVIEPPAADAAATDGVGELAGDASPEASQGQATMADELPEDHPAVIEEKLALDEPVAVETIAEEPAADETTSVEEALLEHASPDVPEVEEELVGEASPDPAPVEDAPADVPVVEDASADVAPAPEPPAPERPAELELVEVELIEVVVDDSPTGAADEAAASDEFQAEDDPAAPERPRPTGRKKAVLTEPEQPSLVDEAGNEPSRPVKRKRASVPSWDEIMFGAPKPKE